MPSYARNLILAPGLLLLLLGQARSASDFTCDRYVAEAVSERAQKAVQFCGFTGPAWGTDSVRDYNGHLKWCLAANQESVDQETAKRRNGMHNCERCISYANRAVGAFRHQKERQCDWTGAAWSDNFKGHLNWCMGAKWEHVEEEENKRELADLWCQACSDYAVQAEQQASKQLTVCNVKLGGARWTTTRKNHLDWCLDLVVGAYGVIDNERQARAKHLDNCAIQSTKQKLEASESGGVEAQPTKPRDIGGSTLKDAQPEVQLPSSSRSAPRQQEHTQPGTSVLKDAKPESDVPSLEAQPKATLGKRRKPCGEGFYRGPDRQCYPVPR